MDLTSTSRSSNARAVLLTSDITSQQNYVNLVQLVFVLQAIPTTLHLSYARQIHIDVQVDWSMIKYPTHARMDL